MRYQLVILTLFLLGFNSLQAECVFTNDQDIIFHEDGDVMLSDSLKIWEKENIYRDEQLDNIMDRRYRANKEEQAIDGYRVQIYFGSGSSAKDQAMSIRANFLRLFPDHKCYIFYTSPDFKLRIGDFRTKSEALKARKEIKRSFPDAFIVPDKIDFPELKYLASPSEHEDEDRIDLNNE